MGKEKQGKNLYVIFVYGNVPELMSDAAFRRPKHFNASDKKIIKCPHCKGNFTTVDETAKIEVYRHSRKTKNITFHNAMTCKACHKQVGIIYPVA